MQGKRCGLVIFRRIGYDNIGDARFISFEETDDSAWGRSHSRKTMRKIRGIANMIKRPGAAFIEPRPII